MTTATTAVTEQQMTPIAKAVNEQQKVITGTYLYEQFVVASQEQITRMQLIHKIVNDGLLPAQLKEACDTMVKKAADIDGEKLDADGKKIRGPKEQSAMNARTVIQQAYGALKFARQYLDAEGFDEGRTGYQEMRVIAKRALDKARIKWTGDHTATVADQEAKRLAKETKQETDAFTKAMKDAPRQPGEEYDAWMARVQEHAKGVVEQARIDAEAALLAKVISELEAKHPHRLLSIADAIYAHLNLEAAPVDEVLTKEAVTA